MFRSHAIYCVGHKKCANLLFTCYKQPLVISSSENSSSKKNICLLLSIDR